MYHIEGYLSVYTYIHIIDYAKCKHQNDKYRYNVYIYARVWHIMNLYTSNVDDIFDVVFYVYLCRGDAIQNYAKTPFENIQLKSIPNPINVPTVYGNRCGNYLEVEKNNAN